MKNMITAVLIVFAFISTVQAEPLSLRPFIAAEAFLPTNAGKGLESDSLAGASALNGIGYTTLTTVETRAAIGFRAGIKARVSEVVDLGLSGGYIIGPNSDVNITATAPGLTGVLADKREVKYARFLFEPTFNAKMSESSAFHLGAGLGVAQGTVDETFACTGNACNLASLKTSSSWSGFTWEVSPYFSSGHAMYGIRYAVFPKFAGNSNNSKIEWSTFAFFAGIVF